MKKTISVSLILFCIVFTSCLKISISAEELVKSNNDRNLQNKKWLIVTHDTELSQEFLIHLKNYLKFFLRQKNMSIHGINVRYTTVVKSRTISKNPFIIFKNEPTITIGERKYRKDRLQIAPRRVIEKDMQNLADSLAQIQPDVVFNIDIKHEHRAAYFTLSSSTQELDDASYFAELKSADDKIIYWKGEILVEHLANIDMIPAAQKTAEMLMNIFEKQLIVK
jgi:hypothetical protein